MIKGIRSLLSPLRLGISQANQQGEAPAPPAQSRQEKLPELADRKGKDAMLYLVRGGRMHDALREAYRQYGKKYGKRPEQSPSAMAPREPGGGSASMVAPEPESSHSVETISSHHRSRNISPAVSTHSQDGPEMHDDGVGFITLQSSVWEPLPPEMQWRDNPHMPEHLDAAFGIRPATLCVSDSGLFEVAKKRGLKLKQDLTPVDVGLRNMKLFINKPAAVEAINAYPELFRLGSIFPSAEAALDAICNGTSPWKLMDEYTNENISDKSVEENIVVTGVLLGYGEHNSRNFAKSEEKRKKSEGRGVRGYDAELGTQDIIYVYHKYTATLSDSDVRPIAFRMWDSAESTALVHKYIEANKKINQQIRDFHEERRRENMHADFRDSIAEFALRALTEPA